MIYITTAQNSGGAKKFRAAAVLCPFQHISSLMRLSADFSRRDTWA